MGGKTKSTVLLTDEERKAKLDGLLGHRFTERGKLQLPATHVYNELEADSGVQDFAIEICRWLGFKPNGLSVSYGITEGHHDYRVDTTLKKITIHARYKHHPYTVAGLIVFAILAYITTHHDHVEPDTAFIEYASIETGLGLWIMNALQPRLHTYEKIYHFLDSAWFYNEGFRLVNYQPEQYASRVIAYAREHRIADDAYVRHILPRCRHLLPKTLTIQHPHYLPESNASIQGRKSARKLWIKLSLIASIIAVGIGLGIWVFGQSRINNDTTTSAALMDIQIRKQKYETCIETASKLQSTYDPNDLFLTRQVDSKKAECESLRNEYNYAVDQLTTNN